jgi:hypothetical protein
MKREKWKDGGCWKEGENAEEESTESMLAVCDITGWRDEREEGEGLAEHALEAGVAVRGRKRSV